MKRLLSVFAALLLVLQAGGPAHAAVSAVTVILARPARVHAGDPVSLSGRGFQHHQRLQLVMTCYPPTTTGSKTHPLLVRALAWVTTGARGGFQRVTVHAPNPPNGQLILCRIAARTAAQRWVSDIDALYAVLPRAKRT